MINVGLSILSQVVKTAAFSAIAGKVVDTLINKKIDQKKWIRQTKFETFTKLTQEILSSNEKILIKDEEKKIKEYATKAILLLDDKRVIMKINDYIYTLNNFSKNCEDSSKDLNSLRKSKGLELIKLLKRNLNKS